MPARSPRGAHQPISSFSRAGAKFLIGALLLGGGGGLSAAARPPKEAKETKQIAVAAPDPTLPLIAELRKPAEDQAIAAAKKLGELGTPQAVEGLLNELSTGLPPRVARAAIDALSPRKAEAAF